MNSKDMMGRDVALTSWHLRSSLTSVPSATWTEGRTPSPVPPLHLGGDTRPLSLNVELNLKTISWWALHFLFLFQYL